MENTIELRSARVMSIIVHGNTNYRVLAQYSHSTEVMNIDTCDTSVRMLNRLVILK